MKKLLIAFVILACSASAQVARKINIDLQPYIQALADSSDAGDTLLIPPGEFTLSKTVVFKKSFVILSTGGTILKRDENVSDSLLTLWKEMFRFDINSSTPCNLIISGIEFRGNPSSLAPDIGIKINRARGFEVINCKFKYFGEAGICIIHDDSLVNGLIHKSEFFHNAKGPDGLGLGYGIEIYGANTRWITDPEFGSNKFIFIEDNTFDYHRHSVAAGGCGKYVFRNNDVFNNNIGELSSAAVDAHEGRGIGNGLNTYSTRAVEIYGNRIINTTFKDASPIVTGRSSKLLVECAIVIRGGEALVYNNTVIGYRFAVGIINFEVSGRQAYPILTQIGYLSGVKFGGAHKGVDEGRDDGDLFCWGNTFSTYKSSSSSMLFYNYQTSYFKEERDYHLYAKPRYVSYIYPYLK